MKKSNRKRNLKITAAALSLIGGCTLMFNMGTEAAAAAQLNGIQTISTNYNVNPPSQSSHSSQATVPDGYVKADYTVTKDPLMKDTPTSKDLSQEEAAEIGAQMLWDMYGINLDNAIIYMCYNAATDSFPRSTWSGDVLFSSERKPESTRYGFTIDSLTGERFDMGMGRSLDVTVPLGLDKSLEKNCDDYKTLAATYAEKLDLVHGKVKEVVYNCQGYSGNDPDISFEVIGENGNIALMTFSRYDQKLKGVGYDTSYRISLEANEKFLREIEKQIDAARKDAEFSSEDAGSAVLQGLEVR